MDHGDLDQSNNANARPKQMWTTVAEDFVQLGLIGLNFSQVLPPS